MEEGRVSEEPTKQRGLPHEEDDDLDGGVRSSFSWRFCLQWQGSI